MRGFWGGGGGGGGGEKGRDRRGDTLRLLGRRA